MFLGDTFRFGRAGLGLERVTLFCCWSNSARGESPNVFDDLTGFVGEWARRLVAVVLCLLPGRHWGRFESLPLANMAAASALITAAAGVAIGVSGYLVYMSGVADAMNTVALKLAASQAQHPPGKDDLSFFSVRAAGALSIFGFALFTPVGLASTYLVLTGCLRLTAYVVNEPLGDPLLTGIDALVRGVRDKAQRAWRRRRRHALEGREVPDRLVPGKWADVPGADYVVIASRRKEAWTKGAIVMTAETWYRLGEPFDFRSPEGLRTAYPLTALQTTEVLRRGVRYELPPLETPPGRA